MHMAQHSERRVSGQPNTTSVPETIQFRETTRFSGAYLREIASRADEYLNAYPDSTRDELVDTISLKESERPRVDTAIDALNQLSTLEVRRDEIGGKIRTFIIQQMIPPGRIVYEAVWTGIKPECLTKPKEEPKLQKAAEPTAQYPFRSARAPQDRVTFESFIDRKRRERDERRLENTRRAEFDKISEEKKSLRDVIVDRGLEIGEAVLANSEMKIELGEDQTAIISYRTYEINPDGTRVYAVVDRNTGIYEEGYAWKSKMSIRADVMVYLRAKAQEQEYAVNTKLTIPDAYRPEDIVVPTSEQVYVRALELGLLQIEHSSDGVRFMFAVFSNKLYPIDLSRNIVEFTTFFDKGERPIRPQFADFLRVKKAELEAITTTNNPEDTTFQAYNRALEDGSLIVRVDEKGEVVFSWKYGEAEGTSFYADIDIEKGRTKPYELSFIGDALTPQFIALLKSEKDRFKNNPTIARELMEKTNSSSRQVVSMHVSR